MYLTNEFSLNMLGVLECPETVRIETLSLDEVKDWVVGDSEEGGFKSFVSHEGAAKLFSALLGIEVAFNPEPLVLNGGGFLDDDILIVGQHHGSTPEIVWYLLDFSWPEASGCNLNHEPEHERDSWG